MDKGLICIDFAPAQGESFFFIQKNSRVKHFLRPAQSDNKKQLQI